MRATLHAWSAPACEAGARPLGALPTVRSVELTATRGGAESGTAVIWTADVQAVGLQPGHIIRGTLPGRSVSEWVVERTEDSTTGDWTSVTLSPLRQLLALRGLVRALTPGGISVAIPALSLSVTDWLTTFVLGHAAADGLAWLSVGTVEYAGRVSLAAFGGWTRAQLLTALERATGYDVVLRALANNAGYAIDVLAERGSDRDPTLLETPSSALAITRTRGVADAATVLMPMGDDRTVMGEVGWVGGAPIGSGPYWVPLTAPNGGAAPINEDGQFVGTYAVFGSGVPVLVRDTRALDSAILVDATPGHTAGAPVVLWATPEGRPVTAIPSPSGIAQRGPITARVTVAGLTPVRNLVRDSEFAEGTGWSDVGGGVSARIPFSAWGQTLSGLTNGSRGAGTGTGTPMPLDGLPANTWLYRGDQLVIDGQTYTITADAIPTTTGALTLAISPTLTGNLSDDTPVTLVRVEQRTLTLEASQPKGRPILVCTDSNTDNLLELTGTWSHDGQSTPNAKPLYPNDVLAGVLFLDVSANGQTGRDPILGTTTVSGAGGVLLPSPQWAPSQNAWRFGDHAALGLTVNTWIYMPRRHAVSGLPGGRWPGWLYQITGTTTINGAEYLTLTADTLGGRVVATDIETAQSDYVAWYSYGTATYNAGVTGTFRLPRETRVLRTSGTQTAGTSSLVFKNDSRIARRDWTNADTITVGRSITNAVLAWTASSVAPGGPGYVITLTLDLAASTVDTLPTTDYTGTNAERAIFYFGPPNALFAQFSYAWLVSISGSTATLHATTLAPVNYIGPTGSVTGSWIARYDHTVTGSASWGSGGTVTLAISAVAAGVTYARGDRVWANWHTEAEHGRLTCLRLNANVSSGATSCVLLGQDRYVAADDPQDAKPVGLYRVFATHSTIPVPSETLDVAASVQANGSGAVSITLRDANAGTIGDNTPFTITRPVMTRPDVRSTGHALRLFSAPGSSPPVDTTAGVQSLPFTVAVPTGETRTVRVTAWGLLTPESLAAGASLGVALFRVSDTSRQAYGTQTGTVVYEDQPSRQVVTAVATLSATTTLVVRLYGGSSSTFSRVHLATEVMVSIGGAADQPYILYAGSLIGWQRAIALLPERTHGARYQAIGVDPAAFTGAATTLDLGQRVRLRDAALGLDTEQRIVRIVWRWPDSERVDLECGALTPRFTDVSS